MAADVGSPCFCFPSINGPARLHSALDHFAMERLLAMIKTVCAKPGVYAGPRMRQVRAFLDGYVLALVESRELTDYPFAGFLLWLEQRHGICHSAWVGTGFLFTQQVQRRRRYGRCQPPLSSIARSVSEASSFRTTMHAL